jgi:hypothetical protein
LRRGFRSSIFQYFHFYILICARLDCGCHSSTFQYSLSGNVKTKKIPRPNGISSKFIPNFVPTGQYTAEAEKNATATRKSLFHCPYGMNFAPKRT